jgi:hypothetical protein
VNDVEPDSSRRSAAGCRNTILVIVVLAVVGFAWAFFVPHDTPVGRFFASIVAPTSAFVFFLIAYGLIVNFRSMVDWVVVRNPPVIDHPVLGEIRYDSRRWSGRAGGVHFGFEGARKGPDPLLLDAVAHAIEHLDAFAARGRERAQKDLPDDLTLGPLKWVDARPGSKHGPVLTDLGFALTPERYAYMHVTFLADEPIETELH